MKKLILITLLIISNILAYAQIGGVLNKARNKIEKGSVNKVDSESKNQTSDKIAETSENKNDIGQVTATNQPAQTSVPQDQGSIKAYSKYDFVPGEKIIAFEDFMQTGVGDFPDRWNTNASAEVVTIDGKQGHWLMFTKGGVFAPELTNKLPDNFTFEFDLLCSNPFNPSGITNFFTCFTELGNPSQPQGWQ